MSDITLKHNGWIVVADGHKALFLHNVGDERFPNLEVFRELEHDNPPSREQGTDRPGRYSDAQGPSSSAIEKTDWHMIEKTRFAVEISERLYKYAHAGRFDSLVVVAPPQVLGDLRKAVHKEVADRIIAEVPKDLTGHPIDRIEDALLH